MTNEVLDKIFLPDGGPDALGVAFVAQSGAGKTTLLTHLINSAVKMGRYENTRFVYVSVKREHLFDGLEPVPSEDAEKSIIKEQITVIYPSKVENYDEEVNEIIELIFNLSEQNPESSFCIVVDDCNVLDSFQSVNSRPSPAVKKAAIAGRSKGIKLIPIIHRLGNLPRIFNGNTSGIVLMNLNKMDLDYGKKIFALDPDEMSELIDELGEFRWAFIDLIDGVTHRFSPVAL